MKKSLKMMNNNITRKITKKNNMMKIMNKMIMKRIMMISNRIKKLKYPKITNRTMKLKIIKMLNPINKHLLLWNLQRKRRDLLYPFNLLNRNLHIKRNMQNLWLLKITRIGNQNSCTMKISYSDKNLKKSLKKWLN